MHAKILGLLILVMSFSATQAFGQDAAGLAKGSRVRLEAAAVSRKPVTGTIVALDATSITLLENPVDSPKVVPRDAITKLEVSTGRRSKAKVGALIGAVALAISGASEPECSGLVCPHEGAVIAFAGAVGAGLGALAREGDEVFVPARGTPEPCEARREAAASEKVFERLLDKPGQTVAVTPAARPRAEGLIVIADNLVQRVLIGTAQVCRFCDPGRSRGRDSGSGYHDPTLMHDELSVLKLVTARLEAAGIAYMVTGSVAVSLYAEPRMTRDIDLVVELHPPDAVRLVDMFGAEFTCDSERIRDAIANRSMFNLIHTAAVVKIDVIVRKDTPYREEEFRRRRLARIDGSQMWVVSAEDLILSKIDWARSSRSEVQLRDVRNVIAAQPSLDWPYLETWAERLSVQDLLREASQ